eukprot:GFYU01002681.1.p1 GENE.GFYU01002681.1~~GFYU01002681.1.p1  ORF type:complete len:343 (+),score=93.76 GFYU01002681.1:68-1030(+)
MSKQAPLVCPGHTRPISGIQYSNVTDDGIFLVSSCLDGKPMLRNGETGDWIGTFQGHKGATWGAALNVGATKAATGSADFTAKIWNAVTGEEEHTLQHKHIVKSVQFSKDSTLLLTGGNEKKLRVWDLNAPSSDPFLMEGHTDNIKVAYFYDENCVLSGSADKCLKLWDRRTGNCEKSIDMPGAVTSMEISRTGKYLTTTAARVVQFRDIETLEVVKEFPLNIDVNAASIRDDHKRFIAGGSDFWVWVYDFETGEELDCHKGHHGPVHCLQYSADGFSYASGSEDGTIRLWNVDLTKLPSAAKAATAGDDAAAATTEASA